MFSGKIIFCAILHVNNWLSKRGIFQDVKASTFVRLGSNWRTLLVQQCMQTKVIPLNIPSQQCEKMRDQHDHTEFVLWFRSSIPAQQICSWWRSPKLPNHKRATPFGAELKKLRTWRPLAGSCCGANMSVDLSSWEIRNEQKLALKVWETFSLHQFERNKLKE